VRGRPGTDRRPDKNRSHGLPPFLTAGPAAGASVREGKPAAAVGTVTGPPA